MNLLVRVLGFPATLIHGDTLVWDRWRWLKTRLKEHQGTLLDVGCGSGAFTIGAARMGYDALGLSWDKRNQTVAAERATIANVQGAHFDVCDVRHLGERSDLSNQVDVVVCLETIEHIQDDHKLLVDIRMCLKPGGVLLLTTPNRQFRAIGPLPDDGPLSVVEDGGHVRRGYLESDLRTLCEGAGMQVDDISYCSGFLSQKITYLLRVSSKLNRYLGWTIVLPLRLLPFLDVFLGRVFHWPPYSICLQARKPSKA